MADDELMLNFVSGTPMFCTSRGVIELQERHLAPILRHLLLRRQGLSVTTIMEEVFGKDCSPSSAKVAVKRLRDKLAPLMDGNRYSFIENIRRTNLRESLYFWRGPIKFSIYRCKYAPLGF
jgi:hypothetical protein